MELHLATGCKRLFFIAFSFRSCTRNWRLVSLWFAKKKKMQVLSKNRIYPQWDEWMNTGHAGCPSTCPRHTSCFEHDSLGQGWERSVLRPRHSSWRVVLFALRSSINSQAFAGVPHWPGFGQGRLYFLGCSSCWPWSRALVLQSVFNVCFSRGAFPLGSVRLPLCFCSM